MSAVAARAIADHVAQSDAEISFARRDRLLLDPSHTAPDGYVFASVAATGATGLVLAGTFAKEMQHAVVRPLSKQRHCRGGCLAQYPYDPTPLCAASILSLLLFSSVAHGTCARTHAGADEHRR